jgi:hypothetical protein
MLDAAADDIAAILSGDPPCWLTFWGRSGKK